MATEAVEIVISADDQASKKMATIAANAEQSVKRIKDVGQKTKASTELAGSIANLAGGTQFGAFAGQLGQLTEKVSQFSEVSKAGGAGALAFKAGLVAAAGVLSFQVGKAIGDVVFQTERWNKELEKSRERMKEISAETIALQQKAFSQQIEDVSFIKSQPGKTEELRALLNQVENDLVGVEARVRSGKKAVEEWGNAWKITGERLAQEQEAKDQLERDKERLRLLKDQRAVLQEMLGPRAEAKRIAEAEDKFAKAAADLAKRREEEAMRIAEIRQGEVDSLKVQTELLTKGEEAARSLALQQKGISKNDADQIAKDQLVLEAEKQRRQEEKDLQRKLAQPAPQLQGLESRFMIRGPVQNQQQKIVDNTSLTAMYTRKMYEDLVKRKMTAPDTKTEFERKMVP